MSLAVKVVGEKFPIVFFSTTGIEPGTICYLQTGVPGSPLGLLLSLTSTPRYYKVIATANGFKAVS